MGDPFSRRTCKKQLPKKHIDPHGHEKKGTETNGIITPIKNIKIIPLVQEKAKNKYQNSIYKEV